MNPERGSTDSVRQPSDDPGWAGYSETILVVYGSVQGQVNLADPIGAAEQALFAGAGLAGCFGILTPENPFGISATSHENAARRSRLRAELEELGMASVRIDGLSPNRSHREIGVAIRRPLDQVIAMAKRWEQSAIYWFDGHDMWLIGALTAAPPTRLAS